MVTDRTRAMLTELADLLEALPEGRFNYNHWVGPRWKGATDLSCGTTACAAGWATVLDSFKECGLYLAKHRWSEDEGEIRVDLKDEGMLTGTDAMAQVLGISENDTSFLFIPTAWEDSVNYKGRRAPAYNATAKEVAAHIRTYLNEH